MKRCSVPTEECIHSRRCFMTGEYCSKQTNIQKERKALYKSYDNACNEEGIQITAFVIMNFSDMSNVIYKWKLKTFIESLAKYLYWDKEDKRLYCYADELKNLPENLKRVRKIQVIRSDSEPASNYVICSRICQQMQIADLIVVDVSNQNPNVFYEFGMAVALGKLILPVCFSESFYKMVVPERVKEKTKKEKDKLVHHIGCYPWRKRLFEYYGIRYRSKKTYNDEDKVTRYLECNVATAEENGFSDFKYSIFPYHEHIGSNNKTIGEEIYERLRRSYNEAGSDDNTLVVYTMEGFLNEKQAGTCIINFYRAITAQMELEQCFCGERVGVLVQENSIFENDKDAKQDLYLNYDVGEIIRIGLNQATYLALVEKIKTEDFLATPEDLQNMVASGNGMDEDPVITEGQKEQIIRFTKDHIRNRGMMIYPNYPVYVNRIKNGLQKDILDTPLAKGDAGEERIDLDKFWCLYHVTPRTLRFTNEIVVDISQNCLQSLFWLGAAHGSDIYAITVLHEEREEERRISHEGLEKKERNVFDVAGLWAAVLRSYDTDGFSQQLSMAQLGIERHSRLMIKNKDFYEKSVREYLSSYYEETKRKDIHEVFVEKGKEELQVLESYYRKCLWNPMLKYNRLRIYLPMIDDRDRKMDEPKSYTAKWDVDAISVLSHYLSKRTVIGEYCFKSLREKMSEEEKEKEDKKAREVNYICIGKDARPRQQPLPRYIKGIIGKAKEYGEGYNVIHEHCEWRKEQFCENQDSSRMVSRQYKGFAEINKKEDGFVQSDKGFFMQQAGAKCADCKEKAEDRAGKNNLFFDKNVPKECVLEGNAHDQLGQLILWRDNSENSDRNYFRVSIIGSSGPATYGLATLLVDYEQKEEIFHIKKEDGEKWNLLCRLQKKIRKKLMHVILVQMKKKLDGIDFRSQQNGKKINDKEQKDRYISLVLYAVSLYLSTVFYRYFLPFLSKTDIKRIHNGVRTYISSMMAAKISPFVLKYPQDGDTRYNSSISEKNVMEVADEVPKIILNVMQSFRGVEAFYKIKVKAEPFGSEDKEQERDIREVLSVEELGEEADVNCLFTSIDKGEKKDEKTD